VIKPTYFIYLHRRNDTGEVFYVGKGTRTHKRQYERAYITDKRSAFWSAIVAKAGYSIELVVDCFVEAYAFEMERSLIALHGRRLDGGTLCNMTMGGEGHAGFAPTQETREKLHAAVAGPLHANWGKKLSEETCHKKSESMKSSLLNLKGKKLPDWWKDKIAATKVGTLNPMHGKTGAAHPNSRKVRCTVTGALYDSVLIAAEAQGHKMKTLYNWLSGHRSNPTSLEFA
jgi:hypothetical protein